MKRNTTKTGVFVPSDHHNGHLRGRGDSEPHPCFLLIVTCRGGPLVPAGAHRLLLGQLICAEATWSKERRKKRPNSVFLGLKHLAHCPKSRCKPPSAPLLAPALSPSGHHGHTRPRSSPPTTSPACSRKQSSAVLHSGSVRCLRSGGTNAGTTAR